MRKQLLGLAGVTCVMLVAAGYARGGWAITSVEGLPTHFEAGREAPLDFTVRQHGVEPMGDLKPVVQVTSNGARRAIPATATNRKGTYRAMVSMPAAGDAKVTIETGFGDSQLTLIPIPVIASGAAAPKQSMQEHGRRLFAAKGCASCHTHANVRVPKITFFNAPDLTTPRYAPDYLRSFITDPTIKPRTAENMPRMPKIPLTAEELNAVVSFLSTSRMATR